MNRSSRSGSKSRMQKIEQGCARMDSVVVNRSSEIAVKAGEENSFSYRDNEEKKGRGGASVLLEKRRGGWKYAMLLLANQGLATLAFFGVGVNLVLFYTRVLGQSNADAANNVSKWTGTVYMCSLIGAFLSDSYWGRYLTCGVFQLILVVGLGLVSLSSWIFLIHPEGCGDLDTVCTPSSSLGVAMFYLAIYLVAFGYGGHQPTLATFGADQFDEADQKSRHAKSLFFGYFYFALNVGCLFSNTILVYYEDSGRWVLGFIVSTGAAIVGLVSYLMGTRGYRYVKPCGNPIPRVAQVFVASFRKWHLAPAEGDNLYEILGTESAIKGARKIVHSEEFRYVLADSISSEFFRELRLTLYLFLEFMIRFLDKAATMTEEETGGQRKDPWRLCTVTQVEEAKCVLKLIPVWLCTIIYSVVFTQMASLFVEQGAVMNSMIEDFHIPAASMSVFDIFSVLICTCLYSQFLVPLAGRLTRNPKGISELQRMGVGLIIGMLAMVAAGLTEIFRLRSVIPHEKISTLSIFWQIPQYVLVGASEVFMYVGQLEFFNGQAPDGIKSFGSSLCMASISLGNFVSSLLVIMVMEITAKGSDPGWIPENLNEGHMDRFYFLIAILTAVDFVLYLFCAKWYKRVIVEVEDGGSELPMKALKNENRDDAAV
ncbi:hypothetical protein QQ045_027976 [Rhodiola kirilowii]